MEKLKAKRRYYCPHCHKRIFDAEESDTAVITIKCNKCRRIVVVFVMSIPLIMLQDNRTKDACG